jgi:16S rRNA processing protein RimM
MAAADSGMSAQKVFLGRITGAHGLKGEVKIATFTEQPEDVAAYGVLTNADGTRRFHIAALRSASGGTVIARLQGISGRDAAEELRGTELFMARDALPPLDTAGEFYRSDLIGLDAASPDGEIIGKVIAVHNFGAGDLLEVRFAEERDAALIPFDSVHVPHVALDRGRVTIVRPVYEQGEGPETP